ncbi:MAG: tRNA guanosine(34) transglycosylase Tgt [Alphaproteobacteria bacterium]
MSSELYPEFGFEITHKCDKTRARIGKLKTPHGTIETPNFIFCGTKATVKGVLPDQLREMGTDIILSNTYHLMIQPGADIVEKLGGLHKITGWNGPMLTDSGGFQIFSMGHGSVANEIKGRRQQPKNKSLIKISEEGAKFRAYTDGRHIMLTPEDSIRIQKQLGPDLVVQLDECTPFHVDKTYTAKSMRMSHRWGDRSLEEFKRLNDGSQAIYGIVQGGVYPDLRKESAEYTASRDFFATAIGGSLGGSKEEMRDVVGIAVEHIHPDRPVHLLGIGGIRDIFSGVRFGIDTFDCVSPTRIARHGWALKKGAPKERLNMRNARFREDSRPIDESCACTACTQFSRGYIHHLFKAQELLGPHLISLHNIYTMNRLLREVRDAVKAGTLDALEKEWIPD